MKQTWFKRLLALALCVMLVLIAALPAGADFGDYSGDSDFGDSSDWSSSDSSWTAPTGIATRTQIPLTAGRSGSASGSSASS